MKLNPKLLTVGVFLFSLGLWGGSYLFDVYDGTWSEFPIVISGVMLVTAGIATFVFGLSDEDSKL